MMGAIADASFNLDTTLRLAELVTLIGGGAIIVFRMGRMTERFELIGQRQADEISELKRAVGRFGDVLTDLAVQKNRLDSQAERINLLDKRYEELRHGEGFVYPIGTHLSPQKATLK